MIFEFIAIILIGIASLTEVMLLFTWLLNFKLYTSNLTKYPSVDILIAARDEEFNLAACLDSIIELDYPKELLNVWVGDDDSSDGTWKIIQDYESKFSHVHGVQINKKITEGNGKANVLAQLAHKSKGDWIFMTDADIVVPKQWVRSMLNGGEAASAFLITGTSLVEGQSWLAKIQRLDWLYATSMLKVISDIGVPVSTMGNNMAIKRTAYDHVGGFENLPFSVTEDLEIFKAVRKKFKTVNLWSSGVLNKSSPQISVKDLLIQRKRWMRGAFELPVLLLGILIIQAAYFFAIMILLLFNPILGIILWLVKSLIKFVFQVVVAKKLEENISLFDSFVAEVFSMASLLHYFWPGKIYWKGRVY